MRNFIIVLVLLISEIIMISCAQEGTVSMWEKRTPGDPSPVIQNIIPADSAGAGVLDIIIQGQNFGSSLDKLWVYFGSKKVNILSATPNEIKLLRPNISGDSIIIKVVVQNAEEIAKKKYKITKVAKAFGAFEPGSNLTAIAADNAGNVFVDFGSVQRKIKVVSPDGVVSEFISYKFSGTVTTMRVGPNGYLYIKVNDKKLYGVPNGGSIVETLPINFLDNVSTFDFDQNGNVYAGGSRKSINIATVSNKVSRGPDYTSFNIRAIRVYQNYVYILAEGAVEGFKSGIYRHQILSSDGTLGPQELVLDWNNTGEYVNSKFSDFILSNDGDIFIATDNKNPILMVSASGVIRPLYKDILTPTAVKLTWSGNILYQLLGGNNTGITAIAMGKPGAPSYGR